MRYLFVVETIIAQKWRDDNVRTMERLLIIEDLIYI